MSKPIKVDDEIYQRLDQLRAKGETFGQVIEVLLDARLSVLQLINVLEGQLKYRQWQEDRLKQLSGNEEGG